MWTHAELKTKNKVGNHIEVERLNANESRLSFDQDAPRRMVVIGTRGKTRYAIKYAPAWHVRIVREIQVLRALNKGKDPFPKTGVVSLLGHGAATMPPSATMDERYVSLPARLDGAVRRVRISLQKAKSVARLFERKARARGLSTRGGIRMRYFATQVHDGYQTWSSYAPSLRRRPKAWRRAVEEKVATTLGALILKAHVAHGFAHVDLHPENMLVRVTYRPKGGTVREIDSFASVPETATPDQIGVQCRLFDFDLSYLPRRPTLPTDSPYKGSWNDADLDLWLHASFQQPDKKHRAALAPFTIVHDVARICFFFLRSADPDTMARIVRSWARAIDRPEIRVAELVTYACTVARNYGFHDYYKAFMERVDRGVPAPKVR